MNDQDNPQAEISIGKQGEQNQQDLQQQAAQLSGQQVPGQQVPDQQSAGHPASANRSPQQAESDSGQLASARRDPSETFATRGQADAGNTGLGAHSTLERQDSPSANADVESEHSAHSDAALDDGSQGRR